MKHKTGGRLLIFTDLDGTLLDHETYSCEAARPALEEIRERCIPLVIVSSKTRSEIETMTELLSLSGAFIAENGSAVFLIRDFPLPRGVRTERRGRYDAVILGKTYGEAVEALHRARRLCRVPLRGFSEMTAAEVAGLTGLDLESARRAKAREFSEPFTFAGGEAGRACLTALLRDMGMACLEGGRLSFAQGPVDKGVAARFVADLYRNARPETAYRTVALGDGPNDAPLLQAADVAVLIRRKDGTCFPYHATLRQTVMKPAGIGPEGWNEAVLRIIGEDAESPPLGKA